ncbi:hypothetical protein [Aurantimonas sp. VKM B-3413]|uniref:hypothetical protein n=1 Tax=Aurantimonas sp. VKM B-3413 TaxID=2779401 RepID=UPI001E65DC30|nr:hypothetical protein [Aurantimonas sp. VKM B-3413]MCB8836886.1 hypothetical protein [Aurantimonas sp. VKM B-3413]
MLDRLGRITFRHVVAASLGLVALLFAIGLALREDLSETPYLKIAGSGFIFNYRVADATYGFTALVQKPVKNFSIIAADFENPAGGPPLHVEHRLSPRTTRYGLQTPPVRGIEKGKPYKVTVQLIQNGDGAVLFKDSFTVTSNLSDAVLPPEPLTIGPGYTRNPNLPDGWTSPEAGHLL